MNRLVSVLNIFLVASASITLAGCGGGPEGEWVDVSLSGQVSAADGEVPEGKIHFRVYHLESLEGDLRHPLEEIVDFESDSTSFSHSFSYPLHMGEGLAVHAWVDTDGDGVLCTPTEREDPSGLGWTEDTPAGDVQLDVVISDKCRAANFFYPPGEPGGSAS